MRKIFFVLSLAAVLCLFYACGSEENGIDAVRVTGITLNRSTLTLAQGQQELLVPSISPENAADKRLSWTSGDPSKVSVNEEGMLTAIAPTGDTPVTITVKTNDGGFTGICEVTVNTAVTGISLDRPTLTLTVGESETLIQTVLPEDAANKNVTWFSSDPSKVTVVDGLVTAVDVTTSPVTILVRTVDRGRTAVCLVTIMGIPVESVSLNVKNVSLIAGETQTLVATVLPSGTSYLDINWSSSDETRVTVSQTGLLTAIAPTDPGNPVIITARSASDNTKYDTCEVTVNKVPVTGVTLSRESLALGLNQTHTLVAAIQPSNATDTGVTWSSSDETKVTVSQTGLVTAIEITEPDEPVIITVTTTEGNFTAECEVVVLDVFNPGDGFTLLVDYCVDGPRPFTFVNHSSTANSFFLYINAGSGASGSGSPGGSSPPRLFPVGHQITDGDQYIIEIEFTVAIDLPGQTQITLMDTSSAASWWRALSNTVRIPPGTDFIQAGEVVYQVIELNATQTSTGPAPEATGSTANNNSIVIEMLGTPRPPVGTLGFVATQFKVWMRDR
jgi:uncharacterized protein YjdB